MPNYSFIPKLQIRFSFSVHCGSQGGWKYVQSYLWGSLSQQKQRQSSESRKSHSELYSLAKDPRPAIADPRTLMENMRAFETKRMRGLLCELPQRGRFSWDRLSCLNVCLHLDVALKALSVGESEKTIVSPSLRVWPPVFLHWLQQEPGCPLAQMCLP